MKILVFAHSGGPGGAENALRQLVGLLAISNEVSVVLPQEGSESAFYRSSGVPCFFLSATWFLPNFSEAVLQSANANFDSIVDFFQKQQFALAISNTAVLLHGALIACRLGIPHLTYAHENLSDPDIAPNVLSVNSYVRMIEELSDGFISCSDHVSRQFRESKRAKLPVLEPYDYTMPALQRRYERNETNVIQVIGTQSIRKNVDFAVTLAKSLILRGTLVRLDIIGSDNNGTNKLTRTLAKRGIPHRIISHQEQPLSVNVASRVITLICSTSEPYGLTIPESLRFGVPILASESGGPQELLPPEFLYPVSNLDQAVRAVEKIFNSYEMHVTRAYQTYERLGSRLPRTEMQSLLEATLASACENYVKHQTSRLDDWIETLRASLVVPISPEEIAQHISQVDNEDGDASSVAIVLKTIEHEREHSGAAVLKDVSKYDVVPFCMSPQMDRLYKDGLGLSIELAATYADYGRLQMAAFIICALLERQSVLGRPLTVLALGDGIGIDSMRMAAAGFEVDYMDYDHSKMSRVAALNLAKLAKVSRNAAKVSVVKSIEKKYDVIVCLEVMEHVDQPRSFATSISGYLADDGLLFISECFNGIENRWPTHLHTNEQYAGALPWLLNGIFTLVCCNHLPFGKPYVFKQADKSDSATLALDRMTKIAFINNQLDIGV